MQPGGRLAVNVPEFGAIADGMTECIWAFRNAHNALPPDGGTIIIPAGHYKLSDTWTITKPVNLIGVGVPISRAAKYGVGTWLEFAGGITGIKLPSSSVKSLGAGTSQISNLYVMSQSGGKPLPVPPKPDGTPGTPLPEDGIVIGVHGVIIRDCAFAYFGRYGILVGDGSGTNNANGTLIEATRCEFNGGDGFHLKATYAGCGVSTFINLDCSGNKGWGYWHEGGVKNTFLTAHANSNALGGFYEAGNSTAWINCYSESESKSKSKSKAENETVVQRQFFVLDGSGAGLFCLAGDYGAPLFAGGTEPLTLDQAGNIVVPAGSDDVLKDSAGNIIVPPGSKAWQDKKTGNIFVPPGDNALRDSHGDIVIPPGNSNALRSPANIIIADARGYPTRLSLSVALTIGRVGSTGALQLFGGSAALGPDWIINGSAAPDRAIQIFNQQSFRPGLSITGGSDATAPRDPMGIATNDRVGIGSTNPQAKVHIRPHVTQPALDALRVDDDSGAPQLRVGAGGVVVTGTLTKAGGGFKIDHPLNPAHKLLAHSFVESSDRKNVYDGLTKLDATGEATVKLPAWFEAVNRDCRYQLTAIGGPAPNLHIARKMKAGRFRIAGGKPGSEISWQVTGIRMDPWARAHPLVVEEKKSAGEKGYYLDPALYCMPQEKSVGHKRHPEPSKNGKEILKRLLEASGGTKLRKRRT